MALFFATFVCFAQHKIPSSPRSKKAIQRVKPKIVKELNNKGLKFGSPIFMRIFKLEKQLEVWIQKKNNFALFKTYPICTYGDLGLGPKLKEGDGKAPEGFYFVKPAQLNPLSEYHLAFNIGYPNRYDRYHRRTGSFIMVHGKCVSIGCYAMTDSLMEEIYALADTALRNGQSFFRIHIFPFKMNQKNMKRHRKSKWYDFWSNLKEGHDFFEKNHKIPPNVLVRRGRYGFRKP